TFSKDGKLFGVTHEGGANGYGTVFSLNTDGSDYRVLYSFGPDEIGGGPWGELLLGKDGNFYGTNFNAFPFGGGSVYRLSPDGTVSLVADFEPFFFGGNPMGRLTEGPAGILFGTLLNGGPGAGGGAFSVTTSGQATLLQPFDAHDPLSYPETGLVKAD